MVNGEIREWTVEMWGACWSGLRTEGAVARVKDERTHPKPVGPRATWKHC